MKINMVSFCTIYEIYHRLIGLNFHTTFSDLEMYVHLQYKNFEVY